MTEKIQDDKARPTDGGGGYDSARMDETNGAESYTLDADDEADKGVIDGLDPVYAAKARVLNRAIQDIGMGRYQWALFFVIGFGWAQDNLWPIVTSLILPAIAAEFSVGQPPLLTLAQNIGLLAGAVFWGFGCDIFGRRWGFNLTLDSAIFLEFLPASHAYLLTVLSIFWAFAQLYATLIAWPLLGTMTCSAGATSCTRSDNMGWRYFVICMGGSSLGMFLIRFLCFTIYESPKYHMGKGKDDEAVRVVHEVARRNGKTSNLTVEDLRVCEGLGSGQTMQTDNKAVIKRRLEALKGKHVKALFATRKLAFSTASIMLVWAFIGLAFPLYNAFIPSILQRRAAQFGEGSTYTTYRNSCIIAVLGIPGCVLGGVLVETRFVGRKGTLALATMLTGLFILLSTIADSSDALLGWNCAYSFCSNVMYAVLYAYTPEIFPTKDRGTGNALTATANRVFGIMAPIVAIAADLDTPAPVYVSGALFIVAACVVCVLPYESRGKASL